MPGARKDKLKKWCGVKTMKVGAQLIRDFMNLVFPPVCAVCRVRLEASRQQGLCPRCFGSIGYVQRPFCRVCGMELAGEEDREYGENHFRGDVGEGAHRAKDKHVVFYS